MTLKLGQPSTIGQSFCPILALSKLPYKFMLNQKDLSEHISLEFFADGKFCKSFPACAESFANMSHREKKMDSVCWHILWRRALANSCSYFAWPMGNAGKPALLVPMQEVESLLKQINDKFRSANLSASRLRDRHPGFSIVFNSKLARLRPRFLAVVSTHETYTKLEFPEPDYLMPDEAKGPELSMNDREVDEYDTQLFQAIELGANKKKKGPSRTPNTVPRDVPSRQAFTGPRNYALEMEQVQRFLGLRPAPAVAGELTESHHIHMY